MNTVYSEWSVSINKFVVMTPVLSYSNRKLKTEEIVVIKLIMTDSWLESLLYTSLGFIV